MQCGGANLVGGINVQTPFNQLNSKLSATEGDRLVECRVALTVPETDIRTIGYKQLESLLGAGPDDMEERRFPDWVCMIHRNTGLDAIAQFFQVTKTGRLNNIILILAGRKERNPRQAKRKGIKW